MKLTRLLRLLRLLQKMDRYSQHTGMILTLLMLCFSLVAHWLACIWFVLAEKKQIGNDTEWEIGLFNLLFVFPSQVPNNPNTLTCGLRSYTANKQP